MERLRRRRDFLEVSAKGRKAVTKSLVLLARPRPDEAGDSRVGFTVSRKIGNAVTRNRVKRRLREAARTRFGLEERPACDYVIIARKEAAERSLGAISDDLTLALSRLPQEPK